MTTRLNISVPDDLAELIRSLELPISAICQRALKAEIVREMEYRRATEK